MNPVGLWRSLGRASIFGALCALTFVVCFPLVWAFFTSVKPKDSWIGVGNSAQSTTSREKPPVVTTPKPETSMTPRLTSRAPLHSLPTWWR